MMVRLGCECRKCILFLVWGFCGDVGICCGSFRSFSRVVV